MKLAIVIPYRDRYEDLKDLHEPLRESLSGIDNSIIVSEQADEESFNRGLANNVGMEYAIENGFTHMVTHDVDSIPILVDYSECPHIARLCGIFNGKCTPHGNMGTYMGGIVMLSREAAIRVNGYPNAIFGWGHEDDILRMRAHNSGVKIEYRAGFYKVRPHDRDMSKFWENGGLISKNLTRLGGLSDMKKYCTILKSKDKFGIRLKFKCKKNRPKIS